MSVELDAKIARMNKLIDIQVDTMTKKKCPHTDIVFMNTVVRPFLEQMEFARSSPDASKFVSSAEWLVTLLVSETLLNTVPRTAEELIPAAQDMLARIAKGLATTLQVALNSPTEH